MLNDREMGKPFLRIKDKSMVVQIRLYQTKQTKWCLSGVSKKMGKTTAAEILLHQTKTLG